MCTEMDCLEASLPGPRLATPPPPRDQPQSETVRLPALGRGSMSVVPSGGGGGGRGGGGARVLGVGEDLRFSQLLPPAMSQPSNNARKSTHVRLEVTTLPGPGPGPDGPGSGGGDDGGGGGGGGVSVTELVIVLCDIRGRAGPDTSTSSLSSTKCPHLNTNKYQVVPFPAQTEPFCPCDHSSYPCDHYHSSHPCHHTIYVRLHRV